MLAKKQLLGLEIYDVDVNLELSSALMMIAYIIKVHRLDRESSGLHLMGRTEESISHLHLLFSNAKRSKSLSKVFSLQLNFPFVFTSFPSSREK